jgi:uncharacterized damage-inducible protein DinB
MLNINTLNELSRQMEWADAAVWAAVLASSEASQDSKLREYLIHLHLVQRTFLLVWRGEPLTGMPPEFRDARALMNWGRENYSQAFAHLNSLSEEELNQALPLPWSAMLEERLGRPPAPTTKAETALQVALHSMYHRGQVNARLREIGAEPPLVDYIVWLWLGRPGPAWP